MASSSLNDPVKGNSYRGVGSLSATSTNHLSLGRFDLQLTARARIELVLDSDTADNPVLRVGENGLSLEGLVKWNGLGEVDPFAALSCTTSIVDQYERQTGEERQTAAFRDPIVSGQSVGGRLDYSSQDAEADARMGVAIEQIRARLFTRTSDDPSTPDVAERYRVHSGIEFNTNARLRIDSNVNYIGHVNVFGSFEDLAKWRFHADNEFRFSLLEAFAFTWTFRVRHDVSETRRTQFASSMLVGVASEL